MRDYTNFERCNGEPCCVFAERICADNYKELLEKGKDSNGEEVFGEMLADLLYLAELIDFMGITSCFCSILFFIFFNRLFLRYQVFYASPPHPA